MRHRVTVGIVALAVLLARGALAAEAAEETGKAIAFDSRQGNCLACHAMPTVPDAVQAGNGGPPLIAMSARFPDKQVLRAKVWDATASNPGTMMPPYGKHRVLTEQQIDKVVDFIYGL